ncbi:MAG: efflux RND transporter periplasmic adaptor subunit [Spirosomataceae bacterium]
MKKRRLLGGIAAAVIVLSLATWYFTKGKTTDNVKLTATVKKGRFEIIVNSTGELRARNETKIQGPGAEMEEANLWNGTKIQNLVAEGTVVKPGDFVASLDQSPVMTKVSEAQLELQKKNAELNQAKLDTALTLRDARDELANLKFQMEQSKLEKEQSVYEAPAVQRMKQLDYEKAERTYVQKKENYKTKVAQGATKCQIINSDLQKAQNSLNKLTSLMQKMNITAPKSGMVIYDKEWNGRKKVVGSEVRPWNPTVAILPDLSEMQVITYINEVDIRKIKVGQPVDIGLDADPTKKLKGVIGQVANVGEQRPNSDAKVFEVVVDVLTKDASLRPSMTTSCKIVTAIYNDVLSIPLEAINNSKNVSFVYKKEGSGVVKQEIKIADVNDSDALIYSGLTPTDEVFLNVPADTTGTKLLKAPSNVKKPLPTIDKEFEQQLKMRKDTLKPANRSGESGGGDMIIIG